MSGRPRNNERRQELQHAFLAAFAECGVIMSAAKQVGISASTHHRWLREDEDYAQQFTALRDATDPLWRNRKKSGKQRGFRFQDGPVAESKFAAQAAFLRALAETGILRSAAEMSGVSASNHFRWLHTDTAYAEHIAELAATRERAHSQVMRRNALDTNAKRDLTAHEKIVKQVLDDWCITVIPQDTHTDLYALDFFAPDHRLVIEVDGGMHSSGTEYRRTDSERDAYLTSLGYHIHRIPHRDIDDGSFIHKLRAVLGIT